MGTPTSARPGKPGDESSPRVLRFPQRRGSNRAGPPVGDVVGGVSGLGRQCVPVLPRGVTAQSPLPPSGGGGHPGLWGPFCGWWDPVALGPYCLDVPALSTAQDPAEQSQGSPGTPCLSFPICSRVPDTLGGGSSASRLLGASPWCGTVALKKAAGSLAAPGWPLRGP